MSKVWTELLSQANLSRKQRVIKDDNASAPNRTTTNRNMASRKADDFDVVFKVLLLGESCVGKTSIIRSLKGEKFNMTMMSTVGIDFEKMYYTINKKRVKLEIWDTAGQERFRTITAFHYRNVKCLIVIYDITNRESFDRLKSYWLKSIEEKVNDVEPVPVFFVGNKVDLFEKREVTLKEGQEISERQFANGYYETSALTGANIHRLFENVAETMVERWSIPFTESSESPKDNSKNGRDKERRKSIKLHDKSNMKDASKTNKCCS